MSEEPTPRVVIHEGGPYEVTGEPILTKRAQSESIHGEPLDWDLVGTEDADYKRRKRYLLCRCGQSNAKPYCDGTHGKIDFDGKLTADRAPSASRRKLIEGDGISMTDDGSLCEHAGFCGTRFTNVWAMMGSTRNPEVRERARRMISNCPSGRLGFGPGFLTGILDRRPFRCGRGPQHRNRRRFGLHRLGFGHLHSRSVSK